MNYLKKNGKVRTSRLLLLASIVFLFTLGVFFLPNTAPGGGPASLPPVAKFPTDADASYPNKINGSAMDLYLDGSAQGYKTDKIWYDDGAW
ncbi:MAG: hypothetical protein ACTSU5_09490, partial [Promethearchaeota archaeon]